jgi:hypothetical protein
LPLLFGGRAGDKLVPQKAPELVASYPLRPSLRKSPGRAEPPTVASSPVRLARGSQRWGQAMLRNGNGRRKSSPVGAARPRSNGSTETASTSTWRTAAHHRMSGLRRALLPQVPGQAFPRTQRHPKSGDAPVVAAFTRRWPVTLR